MLSRDIMELRFERPEGFSFFAGQFVQFQVPALGGEVLRPYSVSSTPADNYLEFCLKVLPDGKASQYFVQLGIGERAYISDAKGVFICHSEHQSSKMFIATGAGLAPIISMIEDRLSRSPDKLKLLFGVRTSEDIFWTDRLNELMGNYKNLNYQLTLSQPTDDWQGFRGRVSEHLVSLFPAAYNLLPEFYICGSAPMVKDVRALLLKQKMNTKSIHWEIF